MDAVADLLRDDDPPPSGVRIRVPAPEPVHSPLPGDREVLLDAGEEVFFEVWDTMCALVPLQGRWFGIGLREVGVAALTVAGWHVAPATQRTSPLRERWPELVPGFAAMDRLVGLMVDAIC